jgi:hypothetical protein
MINKIVVKIFFAVTVTCFSGYCGIKEAHAYLRQNQSVIIDALSRCHLPESPLFTVPCNFGATANVKALLENNTVNDSIMELTVWEFLLHIVGTSNLLSNRGVSIISDSISITCLSELINNCSGANENENRIVNLAAWELIRNVSYPSLHKHRTLINAAVMNSCIEHHVTRMNRLLSGWKGDML